MSERPSCRSTRELIPELVLGVAGGEDRAPALQHLESCAECRREAAELGEVADGLMLLAPEREPSVGFESRVVAAATARRPPRWRRVLASAVAAVVAAAVTGVGAYLVTESDRMAAQQLRTALDRADGRYFGVEFLRPDGGSPVGHLFVYRGMPSWVFAVVSPDRAGSFEIEVVTRDGAVLDAGSIEVTARRNGAGIVLPVDLAALDAVRLVPTGGGAPLEAHLPSPPDGDGAPTT